MEHPKDKAMRLIESARKAKIDNWPYDKWAEKEGLPLSKDCDLSSFEAWPNVYADIYPFTEEQRLKERSSPLYGLPTIRTPKPDDKSIH